MTIEEIIKEAFSQGWNASHECATDFDYEYALKNCLSEMESEVKKLNMPAVGGMFTKQAVINILKARDKQAFDNEFQKYEHQEIENAINTIMRLVPPSSFPDW